MRPLQMAGRLAATTVGGGIPNAPRKNHERDLAAGFGGVRAPRPTQIFKWGRRAASPLAAVAVYGGGKVPGRDESLPCE